VSAKSVKGLTITNNRSASGSLPVKADPSCSDVKVGNNGNQ